MERNISCMAIAGNLPFQLQHEALARIDALQAEVHLSSIGYDCEDISLLLGCLPNYLKHLIGFSVFVGKRQHGNGKNTRIAGCWALERQHSCGQNCGRLISKSRCHRSPPISITHFVLGVVANRVYRIQCPSSWAFGRF